MTKIMQKKKKRTQIKKKKEWKILAFIECLVSAEN